MRPVCPDCGEPLQKRGKTPEGTQRWRCGAVNSKTRCKVSFTDNTIDQSPKNEWLDSTCDRNYLKLCENLKSKVVVTWAQNNTPIHPVLGTLEKYCEENDASLVVIPGHYKNVSLYTGSEEYNKEWSKRVHDYLIQDNFVIGRVQVQAEQRLTPTLLHPLSSKEGFGGSSWAVFGHPQHALTTVATQAKKLSKQMFTTGACTQANYSTSNAGGRAGFHHIAGAIVIEDSPHGTFVRQLNADSRGSFCDLDKRYHRNKPTEKNLRVKAVVPGDIHRRFMLPALYKGLFDQKNKESMLSVLKPEYLIAHDVFDAHSISKHHLKDAVLQFKKHHTKGDDLRSELDEVVDFFNTLKKVKVVVVKSNHDDHLSEYLNRINVNSDHQNALIAAELQAAMRVEALAGRDTNPLAIYCRPRLKTDVKFLESFEEFSLKGIALDGHGDKGVAGARGSPSSFAKMAIKISVGHSHMPCILHGLHQTGSCVGILGYEGPFTRTANAHNVIYSDGKRAMITSLGEYWHG